MAVVTQYKRLVATGNLTTDRAQLNALQALNELTIALCQQHKSSVFRWKKSFHRKFNFVHKLPFQAEVNPAKGIYLWGKVGRGKTMMMDLFFTNLAIARKQRMHFHHFIEQVHISLLSHQGKSDPLRVIAKEYATKVDVLCFDEFLVSDIGDAMLLSGLFDELFKQGVVLVTTSNCKPEELYKNGLQRQRFLPTIALLNRYCQIISVNGEKDHRQHQQQYARYVYPVAEHRGYIAEKFMQFTNKPLTAGNIEINARTLSYLASDNESKVIVFNFANLCKGARSQRDYMALARQFSVVMITDVPQFSGIDISHVASGVEDGYQRQQNIFANMQSTDDEARRFIALVDEFYDQNIEVFISSEVDIIDLYQGKKLAFEFARCESRLMEMQTKVFKNR
ncbi:cell division protein ZapE [Thalassotalea sp. ND16A]|uniref:cell division protein ZapE n=1 Tax=Thalassotalea sp. ND16A TaxID=1535422 RepID=UPI00051A01A4|nr:cell division protein ZapE [Thalassotalea sp. ND16A]KGJ89486.1 hypothetical protein ND16A_2379 [Thalassotalea sp. ND16A]